MTRRERYSRWLYRRCHRGGVMRPKPVLLWLVECALHGWRPRAEQRLMFLGPPP